MSSTKHGCAALRVGALKGGCPGTSQIAAFCNLATDCARYQGFPRTASRVGVPERVRLQPSAVGAVYVHPRQGEKREGPGPRPLSRRRIEHSRLAVSSRRRRLRAQVQRLPWLWFAHQILDSTTSNRSRDPTQCKVEIWRPTGRGKPAQSPECVSPQRANWSPEFARSTRSRESRLGIVKRQGRISDPRIIH